MEQPNQGSITTLIKKENYKYTPPRKELRHISKDKRVDYNAKGFTSEIWYT